MKYFQTLIKVGALALATAFAYSHAHAGDRWNDSGFSLDHHFYSDERSPRIIVVPVPVPPPASVPTYERAPGPLDGINITEGPIYSGDHATVRHPTDDYINATPAEIAKAGRDKHTTPATACDAAISRMVARGIIEQAPECVK